MNSNRIVSYIILFGTYVFISVHPQDIQKVTPVTPPWTKLNEAGEIYCTYEPHGVTYSEIRWLFSPNGDRLTASTVYVYNEFGVDRAEGAYVGRTTKVHNDTTFGLIINNLTTTDNGTYYCRFSKTSEPESSLKLRLFDNYDKINLQLVPPCSNISQHVGSDVTLKAYSPGAIPPVTFAWDGRASSEYSIRDAKTSDSRTVVLKATHPSWTAPFTCSYMISITVPTTPAPAKLSPGAIAGIVIAAIALLLVVVVGLLYHFRPDLVATVAGLCPWKREGNKKKDEESLGLMPDMLKKFKKQVEGIKAGSEFLAAGQDLPKEPLSMLVYDEDELLMSACITINSKDGVNSLAVTDTKQKTNQSIKLEADVMRSLLGEKTGRNDTELRAKIHQSVERSDLNAKWKTLLHLILEKIISQE